MVEYGYAGKILRVNLSSRMTGESATDDYAGKFLGGHGLAAKIYWDEVIPQTTAFDPENRLIFANGPLAGVPVVGGSRWKICGKSPATSPEQFSYCNLGGHWGAHLKFAGYDALVVHGKSENPVYISIDDNGIEIRDASALWGKNAIETRQLLEQELGASVKVVACGPAGENLVPFAVALADHDASGTMGFGAVMGSKKLKAIAVRGSTKTAIAKPDKFLELSSYVRKLYEWKWGNRRAGMSVARATAKYGPTMKKDVCYGCVGCDRTTYEASNGAKGKFTCLATSFFYYDHAYKYYGKPTDVPFFAAKLCDAYGLDLDVVFTTMTWLSRCARAGILSEEVSGIPISKIGSLEFIESLVKKISLREGFGEILAQGLQKAASFVGRGANELIGDYVSKDGKHSGYCPRTYPAHAILWAVEPRHPVNQVHAIGSRLNNWVEWINQVEDAYLSTEVFRKNACRFWGSELAVDFSTYEGKALAAARIQDRECAKESLVLCDRMYPVFCVGYSEDKMGDPTIESRLLSSVTGKETSEEDLLNIGERIFNHQRAILTRERGGGRGFDVLPDAFFTVPLRSAARNPECLAPGTDGEKVSLKGAVVDREKFDRMKDEFYHIRGWDVATGLQTAAKLRELGLDDVAEELAKKDLAL